MTAEQQEILNRRPTPKTRVTAPPVMVETAMKIPSRFVRWGFLAGAFLALPRTFEFIREWLDKNGPHPLNFVTTSVFVVALFLGFQAAVMLRGVPRWGLVAFTIVLMSFSIFCTVDGVYSARVKRQGTEFNQKGEEAKAILPDLIAKKERIEKENLFKKSELERIEKSSMGEWFKEEQRKKIRFDSLDYITDQIIEARKLQISPVHTEALGDSILPMLVFSLLLDLIGPIALMVALFLPGGKNGK